MARARTRAKRTFYLLFALLFLFLLLELNRWLPGTWPGGGGGGFRAAGEQGTPDPARTGERATPPADAPTAPDVVEPPATPPPAWPPKDGVLVEVRGPDGQLADGWRLGIGDGGAEDVLPGAEGTARIRDAQAFGVGFRVRGGTGGGALRHRSGLATPAARWSVHLPEGAVPETARRPQLPVRVVDPATGAPLAGVALEYAVGGLDVTATTDAQGLARLRVIEDTPVEVRMRKEGRVTATALVSPREAGTPDLALDEEVQTTVRYKASPASVLGARLLDAEGRTLATGVVSLRGGGTGQDAAFRVARAALAGAWLETMAATSAGRFVFRRPLAEVQGALEVPATKTVRVRVRDAAGRPLAGAAVTAETDTHQGPRAEDEPRPVPAEGPLRTGPDGSAGLVLPVGARARLLVEAAGAAPMVRALTPLDGSDVLDFVTEYAINAPVRVVGPDGKPLIGARLLARTSMQGLRIVREAATDINGRALIGGFAAGSIEVFAVAPGHAAAAQVVDAAPAMATVEFTLARGFPLHVVVEDPYGRPLEGVDVEIAPSTGGAPLVVMPSEAGRVTSAAGVLTLLGLPDGRYDVVLTRPGYGTQKLRQVRPGAITYFATMLRRP